MLFLKSKLGRYLFLSAIANQLRYPNSHTHYFSCVLLYLFGEANQEVIQEQITLYVIYIFNFFNYFINSELNTFTIITSFLYSRLFFLIF